jgi:ABC-type transport system substrate-binding protein
MEAIVKSTLLAASLVAAVIFAGPAASGTLRIALQEDPDVLDPAQGVSFVGRVVFAGLCDKLIDIDQPPGRQAGRLRGTMQPLQHWDDGGALSKTSRKPSMAVAPKREQG